MASSQMVYQKAKACFSENEYKRFFQASKTLETQKIPLKKNFAIISQILEMLPEFDLVMAALFVHQKALPENIKNRYLNEFQKQILSSLLLISDNTIKTPSKRPQLIQFLFESFIQENRSLYYFLAELFIGAKATAQMNAKEKIEYAQLLFSVGAPLAYRLGLHDIKELLETISFSLLFPQEYAVLEKQRKEYVTSEHAFLRKVVGKIRYFLKKYTIPFTVKSRVKNIYSIYRKLKKKGRMDLHTLKDIFAVRIMVPEPLQCYLVLGLLHQHFPYIPGKIKDYISKPKPNAYQSLHTTLEVPFDEETLPVEIQIRTEEMHTVATSGIAAHLLYKGKKYGETVESKKEMKKKMSALLSHFSEKTFLHSAEDDIFAQHLFVFSRNGKIYPMIKGATALDFAYTVHTDVGNHALHAIINGKETGLSEKLKNGDSVEIVVSARVERQESWIRLARVPEVKKIIRSYYHKES